MPINITSISIANEMTGSFGTVALKGNLFNKCTATININAYKLIQATSSNDVQFGPTGYGALNCIKLLSGNGGFSEFDIGEEIAISGTSSNNGTCIIIEKISNNVIRTTSIFTPETSSACEIKGNYDFTALEFQYGLIENNEAINFLSKIDGNVMKYKKDTVTTSHTSMTAVGVYSSWKWHNSYPTIKEISPATSSYGQDFEIIHTFYIHPLFLYNNTLTTPPTWFDSTSCLKYVFSVKCKFYPASTEGVLYKEFSLGGSGNTGWLNENYNTGITNYSISGLTFKRVSDLSTVDGVLLEAGDKTRVSFAIDNTDSIFSNGNTKIKVHIMNVPFDTDEYIDTLTEGDVNFTFDTALNTLGSAAVNGEMSLCIDDFTCTYVSANQATVQFDVNLDPADVSRINGYDTKKYFIAVSVCDHTKSINNTDSVTLSVDYEEYAISTGEDGVVTEDTWDLFDHTKFVSQDVNAQEEAFSEDELLSVLLLKVDGNNTTYAPSLRSFEVGVRLKNTITGDSINLDRFYLDVSGNPIVNGLQFVNQSVPRGHQAMSSEVFKSILIERDLGLDATNEWYYRITFPFLVGWEDWENNTSIPTDFFDTSLENNGLNNEWAHLESADYETQVFCNVVVRMNGVDYEYNLNKIIKAYTYESNPTEWANPNIKTYDMAGNEITPYILGYDKTVVICEFEKVMPGPIGDTDFEIVMRLEPKDNGGRNVSTRLSSVFEITSATQWESYNSSNKVMRSISGSLYRGKAVIDHNQLQNYGEFDITARIYDLTAVSIDGAKLQENGDFKLQENGDFKLLE